MTLSDEVILLSESVKRCHHAAVDAGDAELAAVLHEMGWTVAQLLVRLARGQARMEASRGD